MKRFLLILSIVSVMSIMPFRSDAADMGPIFTTPLFGASIGALAGSLLFWATKQPADHYNDYLINGAAIGGACGLALGINSVVNASASFHQGDKNHEKIYGFNIAFLLE